MPALVTRKFEEEPIKTGCASMDKPFSNYKSIGIFFCTQGHVTQKSVIRYDPNSNYSEILCLSRLSASLIKIRSKVKVTAKFN